MTSNSQSHKCKMSFSLFLYVLFWYLFVPFSFVLRLQRCQNLNYSHVAEILYINESTFLYRAVQLWFSNKEIRMNPTILAILGFLLALELGESQGTDILRNIKLRSQGEGVLWLCYSNSVLCRVQVQISSESWKSFIIE